MDGDSLRGLAHQGDRPVAFARKDVVTVEARRADTGKTVALVLSAVVVCGGVAVLAVLASGLGD